MMEESSGQCLVFWLSERSKVVSGLSCLPLGALGFALSSVALPGAFGRVCCAGGNARLRARFLFLVGGGVQLLVLLAAQLSCGGPRVQRPLLVGLAEGVGAELAEGLRVFPADITVVPGTVPTSCRGGDNDHEQV